MIKEILVKFAKISFFLRKIIEEGKTPCFILNFDISKNNNIITFYKFIRIKKW